MITDVMHNQFLLFTVICITCLYIGGWIIKKYCKQIPEQFIPLILVTMSLIAQVTWCRGNHYIMPWPFYVEEGLSNGFAAVGVNQLVKQIKRYYNVIKYKRHPELDRRKRDRKIS